MNTKYYNVGDRVSAVYSDNDIDFDWYRGTVIAKVPNKSVSVKLDDGTNLTITDDDDISTR